LIEEWDDEYYEKGDTEFSHDGSRYVIRHRWCCRAHKLQDGITVQQTDIGDMSGLQVWNEGEMLAMRKAFNALGSSLVSSGSGRQK